VRSVAGLAAKESLLSPKFSTIEANMSATGPQKHKTQNKKARVSAVKTGKNVGFFLH